MTDVSEREIFDFLAIAHTLSDQSAKVILPYFRQKISVDHKDGKGIYDPVTDADRNSEQVIRSYLAEYLPDHSIIGEEFGHSDNGSPYCWIIDPIDGTRAFVMGSPLWGTLIGLEHNKEPLLGMMNQPFTGERFWGTPDGSFGWWPNDTQAQLENTLPSSESMSSEAGRAVHRLSTSGCVTLSKAIITTTCPDLFGSAEELEAFHNLRACCKMSRYGGDCYSYCLLALGQVDLIVESGLAPYDIAPLIPLVKGAGGVITTWDGGPANLGGKIIASASPELHEAALVELNRMKN